MIIIQIVPRLPPSVDGLGDYALSLAFQMRQDFGIETHFIVGDQKWVGDAHIEGGMLVYLHIGTKFGAFPMAG